MQIIIIPAVDPAVVRAAAGLSECGSFYQPRKKRPDYFKALDGKTSDEHARTRHWEAL